MSVERSLRRAWDHARFRLLMRRYTMRDDVFIGKSVAVIGPADTSLAFNDAASVEAHDIVIRFNSAFRLTAQHGDRIGKRTDILAHSLSERGARAAQVVDPQLLKEHQTKYVLWPTPRPNKLKRFKSQIPRFSDTSVSDAKLAMVPLDGYEDFLRRMDGAPPSVGLATIAYLLGTGFSELYVSGFSFFSTPYAEGYNANVDSGQKAEHWANESKHDFSLETRVFCGLIKDARRDKRAIRLDPALTELVEAHREMSDRANAEKRTASPSI